MDDLLKGRPERLHQLVRKVTDEAHRVGDRVVAPRRRAGLADRGIERGEQGVLHEDPRTRDAVQQAGLPGVGVPGDGDLGHRRGEALRPLADGRTGYVPAAVRETLGALRGTATEVYRDNRNGTSNGIYAAGWLRRDEETGRWLLPGERQVWDGASPNVPVAVPWPVGGERSFDEKMLLTN